MKKLLFLLVVLLSFTATSQIPVELSGMTHDLTLGSNQEYSEFVTYGDVNLNGYKLTIRNAHLEIKGNLNGSGTVKSKHSGTFCVQGSIQNQVNYKNKDLNCSTLSTSNEQIELKTYSYIRGVLTIEKAKYIGLYNISGQKVLEANRNNLDLTRLNKGIYIIRTSNDRATTAFKLLI